jgi:hypothetical protein
LLSCLLLAGPARADALLDDARRLMAEQRPEAAWRLLEPHELARAGDPAYDHLLGIAAVDAGHVTRGILALERVLAAQPDNTLARAEIGRAYLAAGEPQAARRALEDARRGTMPPAAAATIDRLLGTLAERPAEGLTRPVRRAFVALTAGRDSNVNSAAAASEVAIPAFGGLLFTLDPQVRGRADTVTTAQVGADGQWPLAGGFSAIAAAGLRRGWNAREQGFEQQSAEASAGGAWERAGDRITAALQATTFRLGGQRYREAHGLGAQWQHTLRPTTQLSAFSEWSRLDYASQPDRNADRTVLGLGAAQALDSGRRVPYASLYTARERSRSGQDAFAHRAWGARAGLEQAFGPSLSGFASVQFERRQHVGEDALFMARRADRQTDLVAGLRWAFAADWRLTPQLLITRNASNLPLADYRRRVLQLTLRRDFE